MFHIWQSWAVATPVRFLISNVLNDPIMMQQLLLTLFFYWQQSKPNTIVESFPCWNGCMWVLHCCITSLFMFLHQWQYLMLYYFIQCALEFYKVRSKLLGLTFKAGRTYFLISSHQYHPPLHCLILTLTSNYDAYCCSFSTGTIDLYVGSIRIFGCCTSSLVNILVVPVDSSNFCVRGSECKHIMPYIHVG